jgi:purine-nucleoside phosphorylase
MCVSRSRVEAYFYGNPEFIANKVLFIKRDVNLCKYKSRLTDIVEFGNVWHGITGQLRGQYITVIVTGIGQSLVGDAVYALDRPGCICLYSGTCGGLHQSLEIGDYFIAEGAVCAGGFASQLGYSPLAEIAGDFSLLEALRPLLASRCYRLAQGITFSTDSVVRESDCDFWRTIPDRCQVTEMSTAAFYAAACATGKKAAAYFWVSDLPTRGKSFFDTLAAEDIQTKQNRFEHSTALDLELISCL